MKRIRTYKIERDTRNIGSEKWAVVGAVSGYVYYEGTRFDCCFYVSEERNRVNIENEELGQAGE